jgi:hypothetical protein
VTQTNTPTAPKRKTCSPCKARFFPTNAAHTFCSDKCRQRGKRLATKQKSHAQVYAFTSWLVRQCKRAGTVQILTDVDLCDLYIVWKFSRKANGFGLDEDEAKHPRFEISHIAPVVGPYITGTLHPSNLVVCPAPYNRARYNNWDGKSGRWVKGNLLKKQWRVSAEMAAKAVLEKVQAFCPDSYGTLLATQKLVLSPHAKMVKHLVKLGVNEASNLQALTYDQLSALVRANPKLPQPATMVRHLLKLQTVELVDGSLHIPDSLDLESMPIESLQSLYQRCVQPKVFKLDRMSASEVYELESERLGYSPVQYWQFLDSSDECWDSLHGLPLTMWFATSADDDLEDPALKF